MAILQHRAPNFAALADAFHISDSIKTSELAGCCVYVPTVGILPGMLRDLRDD